MGVTSGTATGFLIADSNLDGVDPQLRFLLADDSANYGYNETMRINSAGNVGIGTTSPGAKLDVNGEMRVRNAIRFVDSSGSTQSDDYYFYKTNKGDGDNQLRLVIQDNGNERFEIWGNGCSTSGGCGANPVRSHYFQADGKAYHSSSVTASSFIADSYGNSLKFGSSSGGNADGGAVFSSYGDVSSASATLTFAEYDDPFILRGRQTKNSDSKDAIISLYNGKRRNWDDESRGEVGCKWGDESKECHSIC